MAERTYKATGITLKSTPMGESDRLLTILTKEYGLVRAITPGSRKPKSSLRAISTGFVVGDLFIVKGRSLDKLVQADCRASFPSLSRDLGKLTAAQYLAELALGQALSDHPQDELFDTLMVYLNHIAHRPPEQTLPSLVQGIFQFLAIAGIAPQVEQCCVTQVPIRPDMAAPNWRVGFDASAGGAIALSTTTTPSYATSSQPKPTVSYGVAAGHLGGGPKAIVNVAESTAAYAVETNPISQPSPEPIKRKPIPKPTLKKKAVRQIQLNAIELALLQYLSQSAQRLNGDAPFSLRLTEQGHLTNGLVEEDVAGQGSMGQEVTGQEVTQQDITQQDSVGSTSVIPNTVWLSLEQTLRYYTQYHFDQPIRSAALIETCFLETMTS